MVSDFANKFGEIRDLRFVLARVWSPFSFLWLPTIAYDLPTAEKGIVAFRPQGDLLAIGTPHVWQLRRTTDLSIVKEQTENPVTALALSDDGCYVVFGEENGEFKYGGASVTWIAHLLKALELAQFQGLVLLFKHE